MIEVLSGHKLRRLVIGLLAMSPAACGPDASDVPQDAQPAFRGYTESVGIVFEATYRWMQVTEGRSRAIQDETAALHYAVATLGTSLMPWQDDRKAAEVADITRQMTMMLAAAGTRSQSEWEAYLVDRAAMYVRSLPTPLDSWLHRSPSGWGPEEVHLSDAQLRQIGRVLVDGVLAYPGMPDGTRQDLDAWALSVGRHFRSRLNQLMQGIEGVPG